MTRFILIRHAAVELPENIIAGRSPGIHLSALGTDQARRLAGALAHEEVFAIYASPRERALETGRYIAEKRGTRVQIAPELDEIDYGDWTGAHMKELAARPHWQAFNSIRSCTRIPGGELIVQVQARIADLIDRLSREATAEGTAILVTHSDVIRAALAYYLSFPIDLMLRLEISPASVSILNLTEQGPSITCINRTEDLVR